MKYGLGIDTSCYMTSVALCALEGSSVFDSRRPVRVAAGERGVRQQEALFQHVGSLGEVMEDLMGQAGYPQLAYVCVSAQPRPVAGSYMPVFTAGENMGRCLAAALHIPFYRTTHQEGHLAAGAWSCNPDKPSGAYLALHLSGGTTEIVRAKEGADGSVGIELLGGTSDLSIGQLLDRVGVKLGFPFPAGRYMDELAGQASGSPEIPSSVRGLSCSLSGAENAAMRAIAAGNAPEAVARGTLVCAARTVEKLIRNAAEQTGLAQALIAGGVGASQFLRAQLSKRMARSGIRLYFADPRWTGDNALGAALIGRQRYLSEY